MKIAIISDTYYPATDGVCRFVEQLAMQLTNLGYTISLLFPKFPTYYYKGEVKPLNGVKFVTVKCIPKSFFGYFFTLANFRIVKEIATAQLVILNSVGSLGLLSILLSKLYKKPIFQFTHIDEHEMLFRVMGLPIVVNLPLLKLADYMYPRFTKVVYATEKFKKKCFEFNARPEQFELVNFGITQETVNPEHKEALRKQLSIAKTDKVLLYLGRLSAEKNIDVIVTVLGKLARHANVKAIIGGIGYKFNEISERIKTEGLPIAMLGMVEESDLMTLFAISDILVTPTFHESMCFTVLEAMSQSTVSVVNGKFKEASLNDSNSIKIADISDETELIEKITYYLDNPPQLARLQKYAYETSKTLSWAGFGRRWDEIIKNVMNRKTPLKNIRKRT